MSELQLRYQLVALLLPGLQLGFSKEVIMFVVRYGEVWIV